jgi:hypothetical protein
MRHKAVDGLACHEFAGPTDEGRHAIGAFPVRILFAAERRGACIRPRIVMRSIVGRVEHDGVVGDAEIVDLLEQQPDVNVMLNHAVAVLILAGLAAVISLDMSAEVHARGVEPAEERLVCLHLQARTR